MTKVITAAIPKNLVVYHKVDLSADKAAKAAAVTMVVRAINAWLYTR